MSGATSQSAQQEKRFPNGKSFCGSKSHVRSGAIDHSGAAPLGRRMCRSTSLYCGCVIRICTRCATSGRKRCRQLIRASRATRLLAG